MVHELVLKSITKLAPQMEQVEDILSYYGVLAKIDKIAEKNKSDLLNKLICGDELLNVFNEIGNSNDFIVVIPDELKEMLKSGKAVFDNSKKTLGNYTPNIRIVDKKGIQHQVTLKKGTNPQDITNGLANIAMIAMVQSILEKLERIEGKLDTIIKGQQNDRIANIIGSFKTFADLYPTFKSEEEKNNTVNSIYQQMQVGLLQIHLQINEKKKTLDSAPSNFLQVLWNGIIHISHNDATRYQNCYREFVNDLQLYNRLILLSDIILQNKGAELSVIKQNHKPFIDYCNNVFDQKFKKKMDYLMQSHIEEIQNIKSQNDYIIMLSEDLDKTSICLECKNNDYKLIKSI